MSSATRPAPHPLDTFFSPSSIALIGASREHINRVMVSYKERDYLSIDSNYHITIHNLQALAKRC